MRHWLMKSEPDEFGIDHLAAAPRQTAPWTGVRNFTARNFMRYEMAIGDPILFWHSSTDPIGIAGVAEVASAPHVDETQFDKKSEYFEPRATRDKPVWFSVEVEFVAKAAALVPLEALRAQRKLAKMELLRKGSRLSISPVTPGQYKVIAGLAGFSS